MPLRWVSPNCQFKLKMAQLFKLFSTEFYINIYPQDRNRDILSLPMQKADLLHQIETLCHHKPIPGLALNRQKA